MVFLVCGIDFVKIVIVICLLIVGENFYECGIGNLIVDFGLVGGSRYC